MDRQSSLPSSLIPHLYSAPRDREPSYNFPPLLSSWREGEPGPSSLHPRHHPTRHLDTFGRRTTAFEPFAERRDQDRDSYFSQPYSTNHHQLLPPLIPPLDEPSFTFDRQDAYSYPPIGSLSISAPSSAHFASPESPDIHTYRAETRSLDFGSNDEESAHKPKRRRQQSLDTDDNTRKSRNPRKTAVACNFCRGRKLRCNGTRPSCYNCTVRKFECEYVPVQRRRGPGKAPRGGRSKRVPAQPHPSTLPTLSDRPPNPVPDYELESLAPELRPYTSVLSLDNIGFGFHPPNYPPPPDPRLMRDYYSPTRETSSDRSDPEDMFRKLT